MHFKILLTTHSTAFMTSGGGESELVQVAELLNDSDVQADIYGIRSRPLRFYDAVMHFSVHADGEAIVRETVNHGKKLFLWPNVWWLSPPDAAEISRIGAFVRRADRLLFKSATELAHFNAHIAVDADKCVVVGSGISDRFLAPADKDLLPTVCDVSDYVLCLGLIEPVKNQLELIRALNRLELNGLMVGGFRDEEYNRQCMSEAHRGIHFLPFIQPCSALLRSALANALVVAEPSFDPPGRSCLEGAFVKKPLVMVDGEWQREHFGGNVWYAASTRATDIVPALQAALSDTERDAKIESNYERVYARHSSSTVAADLIRHLIDAGLTHS
ncbi:glycosyltransferase family 4 protein [Paraburkholderia sp. Ac-20336]|uniref:glycosyltransferase family 4 protein n=1 Tax=Burkholderiaceae TaxID=119060 RepID=UPI00142195BA|nr:MULTISPECIES: glycosyltransferase family 4 protein [Burkholderiaceae]MBN3805307.1 glycosyltransferase family 4 protein [Paraburkholderia sp. Ac-20336]MBN3845281.1 glycosyltransferase family 4 protein [Paraburkholderia sp. Ac-20342]NIF50712.1 glycosyltransferase family 4 protein [Burkholderia sp. Ax-1724]